MADDIGDGDNVNDGAFNADYNVNTGGNANANDNSRTVNDNPVDWSNTPKVGKGPNALVQITATTEQLSRRISAFVERKRRAADDVNRREFCGDFGSCDSLDGCARINSVFVRAHGGKSHVKVTRVDNRYGPQLRPTACRNEDVYLSGGMFRTVRQEFHVTSFFTINSRGDG